MAGEKRSLEEAFGSKSWNRENVAACLCSEKSYQHVHCPCEVCNGKATSRKVELDHWKRSQLLSKRRKKPSNADPGICYSETEENIGTLESSGHQELLSENQNLAHDCTIHSERNGSNLNENENTSDKEVSQLDNAIVKAVLEAMQIMEATKASQKNLEGILHYGKELFCEGVGEECDKDIVDSVWPKTWEEAQTVLKRAGYSEPKEYFICFCRKKAKGKKRGKNIHTYSGKWDVMDNSKQTCKHCGRKGKIRYYYLGLQEKIKLWYGDAEMCNKMLAHWKEKEHWLGREEGWHIKNEIWDGDRFAQLSWFWDPNVEWLLPAKCTEIGCNRVLYSEEIEKSPLLDGSSDIKVLECPHCYNSFHHKPQHAKGDPRNIAYVGHWDGWSPHRSGKHKSGAIEVSVANMSKRERCSIDEVYVIGFVPCNRVPKDNPNALDPFLLPFVNEIKDGFIDGFEVNYSGESLEFSPGIIRIRHLLLCWTADYPGQCEVGKFLNCGVSPCRRCKLKGESLPFAGHHQKYYGGNRYHVKCPWEERFLTDEIPIMKEIQAEERKTRRKKLSSQHGYTGFSILNELHPLSGFDIIRDTVIDIHHNLPLNVIKNQLDRYVETGLIDEKKVEDLMKKIPWTEEFRHGRLPVGFDSRRGHWKAEEYQKFAFPASETVLEDMLPDEEFQIWTIVARLTEMHFVSGRSGWTNEMIGDSYRLSARFNILVEEHQGLGMCVITNHNLLHIPDDIQRFSSPDNFWCYPFERAVKKYSSRSNNCKHFELTFAKAEARREFLKASHVVGTKKGDGEINVDIDKMLVSSVKDARWLMQNKDTISTSNDKDITAIVIGPRKKIKIVELSHEDITEVAQCVNVEEDLVSSVGCSVTKAFLPNKGYDGLIVKPGSTVIVGTPETVLIVEVVVTLMVGGSYHSFVKGKKLNEIMEQGIILRKCWSGFILVQQPSCAAIFHLCDIKRKVMLYPNEEVDGYVVIDFMRPIALHYQPFVPYFPEVSEMVQIFGESEDIWLGQIISVNSQRKLARVQFYTESKRWPGRNIYVYSVTRASKSVEDVHWNSILGTANGQRHSNTCWEWFPD